MGRWTAGTLDSGIATAWPGAPVGIDPKIAMANTRPKILDFIFVDDSQPGRLLGALATAFVLGTIAGLICRLSSLNVPGSYIIATASGLGGLFIWLLTLFIHPLVASSVWCAVSKNSKSVGIALAAILLFALTTSIALCWGAFGGILLAPGVGISFESPQTNEFPEWFANSIAFLKAPFTTPLNSDVGLLGLIAYMAAKAFLFVPFLPEATKRLNQMFEIMQDLCMVWMKHVLAWLPIAVFMMALSVVGENGIGFLISRMGKILAADVVALAGHQLTLVAIMYLLFRQGVFTYIRTMSPAYLVAVASRSSMGTLPTTMKCAEKAGIQESIRNFIFPFGATVNMDGTCAHIMVVLCVILQSLGVDISAAVIVKVGLTVMAASIATAAAPGASVSLLKSIIMAVSLSLGLGIEAEQIPVMIALFASIDFISDALRTQTNLFGDTMVAMVLTRAFNKKTPPAKTN